MTGRIRQILKRYLRSDRGAAAVEFIVIAPVFVLLMVGAIDYGRALSSKANVENAVSAGANYALLSAGSISSAGAANLSQTLATILSNNAADRAISGTVLINNGPKAVITNGTIVKSGTAANADSCYCPTLSGTAVAWGNAVVCGAACPGGGLAGKFVELRVDRSFSPMFTDFGLAVGNKVSARAVVQAQ